MRVPPGAGGPCCDRVRAAARLPASQRASGAAAVIVRYAGVERVNGRVWREVPHVHRVCHRFLWWRWYEVLERVLPRPSVARLERLRAFKARRAATQ